VGHGLLSIGALRSHSDTPHSVGNLWASDQPDSDLYLTYNIHKRHIYAPGGIRTRNYSKRAAANPRLDRDGPFFKYL